MEDPRCKLPELGVLPSPSPSALCRADADLPSAEQAGVLTPRRAEKVAPDPGFIAHLGKQPYSSSLKDAPINSCPSPRFPDTSRVLTGWKLLSGSLALYTFLSTFFPDFCWVLQRTPADLCWCPWARAAGSLVFAGWHRWQPRGCVKPPTTSNTPWCC